MPPLIPYEFEPPATDYEEAHLEYEDTPAGKLVSWPLIGATLCLPKGNQYTEFEQIEALNQEKFQSYGLFGFSINRYHEFLVSMPNERHVCFKMGNIEATFGQVTPLGVLLFDPYHREKYFGAWEYLISLRIIGAEFHEAELAFLNACIAYEEKFGVLPDKFPLDESLILDEAFDFEEDYTPKTFISPPLATNLDPLRFFHNGLSQPDEIAACIYFYRNARIFFLLHNEAEMRRLRHDHMLSDADFSRRILDLVSRDEKGPIFRLINSLSDSNILANALTDGLIVAPTANHLCEAIYSFRNSIVHGKFSYGYSLQSGSALQYDPQISKWKALLRNLAVRSLQQYGSRRA